MKDIFMLAVAACSLIFDIFDIPASSKDEDDSYMENIEKNASFYPEEYKNLLKSNPIHYEKYKGKKKGGVKTPPLSLTFFFYI